MRYSAKNSAAIPHEKIMPCRLQCESLKAFTLKRCGSRTAPKVLLAASLERYRSGVFSAPILRLPIEINGKPW